MHPGIHAKTGPDRIAHVMDGSGEMVTYGQLGDRSARLANLLHAQGLRTGDTIAVFMENHSRYIEVLWAALRAGLYVTPVNRYFGADEAAYVVDDCDARVLVTSPTLAEVATALLEKTPKVELPLMVDSAAEGFDSYGEAIAAHSAERPENEPLGDFLLYSSGTTGRPKGIRFPLSGRLASEGNAMLQEHWIEPYDFTPEAVFLCTAPLYHSMPGWACILTQSVGATAVVMDRFEPRRTLAAMEARGVTHGYFVPTMFVRFLKLPDEDRARHDLGSLKVAMHSAAPVSADVKRRIIDWWGPCLVETYGGTECSGACYIDSHEWLTHPGSVGRCDSAHVLHIVGEDGEEVPPGEVGVIYFEGPSSFEYHKDAEKTRNAFNDKGWQTLGDMGYLDADGYLYLTDRKDFMIVSGGVNIYPQEVEDMLLKHPAVIDAAVFGIPNPDFGEEVKAVVQPAEGVETGTALERELIDYCRDNLAHYKCPRSVEFDAELPRLPTGKLYKRKLRDPYWEGHSTRIV